MIIRKISHPRAALIGNPSDGYFGKTIAFTFTNFRAEVMLYQTPDLEILPSRRDHSTFDSIEHLSTDVNAYGYYGGIRLLKATVKRFYDYCTENSIELDGRNFTLRYNTTIPHGLGLAGSSAIITAAIRSLMSFYAVQIRPPVLANIILSVETDELGIPAGLQDRVAQAYRGLVYMDFDKEIMDRQGYGHYEELDPSSLPPLYVAYRTDLAQGTEVVHSDLRYRYRKGDQDVLDAIDEWRKLTDKARDDLRDGKAQDIGPLIDRNFDVRRAVSKVSEGNLRMVELARSVGATAKNTGSGGAIIGTYTDEKMFAKLREVLGENEIEVLKPCIWGTGEGCEDE
jgi:glucuronokinase